MLEMLRLQNNVCKIVSPLTGVFSFSEKAMQNEKHKLYIVKLSIRRKSALFVCLHISERKKKSSLIKIKIIVAYPHCSKNFFLIFFFIRLRVKWFYFCPYFFLIVIFSQKKVFVA